MVMMKRHRVDQFGAFFSFFVENLSLNVETTTATTLKHAATTQNSIEPAASVFANPFQLFSDFFDFSLLLLFSVMLPVYKSTKVLCAALFLPPMPREEVSEQIAELQT